MFHGKVLKKSSKADTCREWGDENRKLHDVQALLEKHSHLLGSSKGVCDIVYHDDYWNDSGNKACYAVMNRVFNPWDPAGDTGAVQAHFQSIVTEDSERSPKYGYVFGSKIFEHSA